MKRRSDFQRAQRRIAAAPDSEWPDRVIAFMQAMRPTWQESAAFCADAAWTARQRGRSAALAHAAGASHRDPISRRTARHLHWTALRFDFRCAAIRAAAPTTDESLDPYSQALLVFAALGLSQPTGLTAMRRLLTNPEAKADPKVVHTLLHGLWLGEDLPHQAELILDLLAQAPAGLPDEPISLYREARAHRKLGNLDVALDAVHRAFGLLPPDNLDLHADLVRERGLITLARDLRATTDGYPTDPRARPRLREAFWW